MWTKVVLFRVGELVFCIPLFFGNHVDVRAARKSIFHHPGKPTMRSNSICEVNQCSGARGYPLICESKMAKVMAKLMVNDGLNIQILLQIGPYPTDIQLFPRSGSSQAWKGRRLRLGLEGLEQLACR